jgi:antitoxin Phd
MPPAKRTPRKAHSSPAKRTLVDALTSAEPLGLSDEEIDELFRREQCGFRNALPQRTWQLQDAKNRLSELIRRVREGEAQVITVRGEPTAVLVPIEDFELHHSASRKSLAEILLSAPRVLSDEEADELFARDQSPAREVNLE